MKAGPGSVSSGERHGSKKSGVVSCVKRVFVAGNHPGCGRAGPCETEGLASEGLALACCLRGPARAAQCVG